MSRPAVVILNYNGRSYLEKFLPSVIQYSEEADVIVADNASTDDSIEFLKNEFPQIQRLELPQNFGFAGGYNEALKSVSNDLILLLNSDIEVTKNWLQPLVRFLKSNPEYAACQPKIKDYSNKERFEYAGASGGYIDSLGYPYCRGRIFDELEFDQGQYDTPTDIFWSSGACMLIRRKTFFELGGFDVDFFAHMEEIDLCWRINSHSFKIRAIPTSTVYHVGGGTLNKSSPFKTYLNFRNGLYLLIKNLPLQSLILKLPVRFGLDWVAALRFSLQGDFKHALSIAKAHLHVMSNLTTMMKKRAKTSKTNRSIFLIWQHFVLNKKRFSEIPQ